MSVKILVENSSQLIKCQGHKDYTLEASRIVAINDDDSVDFYICDMNSSDSSVVVLDAAIEDFMGCKFKYDNEEVVDNPDWVDPDAEE